MLEVGNGRNGIRRKGRKETKARKERKANKQTDTEGQTDKRATFVRRSSRRLGVGAAASRRCCQLLAPLSPFCRSSLQFVITLHGTKCPYRRRPALAKHEKTRQKRRPHRSTKCRPCRQNRKLSGKHRRA